MHFLFLPDSLHGPPSVPRPDLSSSEPAEDEEEEGDNYKAIFENVSKKWLNVQLTHDVSMAAANSFWTQAIRFFPALASARERSGVEKSVPGFIHVRRQLYKEYCPEVHMKFVYLNRNTNAVETYHGSKCPRKQFPRNQYIKLYEEAHVKVYSLVIRFTITYTS